MALINSIPERFEDGFKFLGDLSDVQFKAIKMSLEDGRQTASVEAIVDKIDIDFDVNDLEEIFISVGSLMPFLESRAMIVEIVKDLVGLAVENDLIEQENAGEFSLRLEYLLNNKQLFLASKAEDLIGNYANKYIQSRVVSDIRPVFNIEIDEEPEACIIIHNLNIHYQSGEEPSHKDISLALTAENLKELIQLLQRAEKKDKSIQNLVEKSGMKNIAND